MFVNKMKIRPEFISMVKDGKKRHEYRLNNETRRNIKIGDIIVLISNQNKNDFIKVKVLNKQVYNSWEDALVECWDQDFKELYPSIEDALKVCYKFYSKVDVDKYGIVVYTITPFVLELKNSSVLLDTNIIIKRESVNNNSFEISKLFNLMDKLGIQKYVHPKTIYELEKYRNEDIKKMMLIKIKSYDVLASSTHKDEFFNDVVLRYSQDENSFIDNEILLQVYNNRINFLITDDNIIHSKAKELYIDDCVFTTLQFLEKFEELYPKLIDYEILSIVKRKIGELDYFDPFFDSLREDYNKDGEFDEWLQKKANESAYVYKDEEGIKGFLYLKTEDESEKYDDISPVFSRGKRLKIGTFKISAKGLRISERFLKIIVDNALKRNLQEIYVTLYENKRDEVNTLRDVLLKWGFQKWGTKDTGEIVLVKNISSYDDNKTVKENYPLVKNQSKQFFLPIAAEFHTDLFPDLALKNEDTKIYSEKAHSYALEKIYVCKRPPGFRVPCPGDLMLIYRMGEDFTFKNYTSVITGICILEEINYPASAEELVRICKNRSVFSEGFLRKNFPRYDMVIKVIFLEQFKKKITLSRMRELGIISFDSGARLTTYLSKTNFELLCQEGRNK